MEGVSITAVTADGDQVVGMSEEAAASLLCPRAHAQTEAINVCMNACMQKHSQMLALKNKPWCSQSQCFSIQSLLNLANSSSAL